MDGLGAQEEACKTHFKAACAPEVGQQAFERLLTTSPVASKTALTERMVSNFVSQWVSGGAASPAPAVARVPESKPSRIPASPKTLLSRAKGRSKSPSPQRSIADRMAGRRFNQAQFLSACRELKTFATETFSGTVIVGNGRSVLGAEHGPAVDAFATVVRFNDYQIDGYQAHIGQKTDLWVVSDWTAIKLINKYPLRTIPTIIAVPYYFMGKPYYKQRRAEVEADLTPEQLERCSFVPMQVVQELVESNHFGDRWPSSGLITIVHMLNSQSISRVHLHGFDFFKEIDGKIHYMEDTHKANHHAAEEERICMTLVQQRRVAFL